MKKNRSTKRKSKSISTGLNEMAYHYTTGDIFIEICQTNILDPHKTVTPLGEKPILWFSTQPYFEQTAAKSVYCESAKNNIRRLTMLETMDLANGLIRFAYPAESLIPWPQIGKQAYMSIKTIKQLEKEGRKQRANPTKWLGSFEPIKFSQLAEIQILKADTLKWVNIKEMEPFNMVDAA